MDSIWYVCKYCSRAFQEKRGLSWHKRLNHPEHLAEYPQLIPVVRQYEERLRGVSREALSDVTEDSSGADCNDMDWILQQEIIDATIKAVWAQQMVPTLSAFKLKIRRHKKKYFVRQVESAKLRGCAPLPPLRVKEKRRRRNSVRTKSSEHTGQSCTAQSHHGSSMTSLNQLHISKSHDNLLEAGTSIRNSGDNFQCLICRHDFKQKKLLAEHILLHLSTRSSPPYRVTDSSEYPYPHCSKRAGAGWLPNFSFNCALHNLKRASTHSKVRTE